MSDGTTNFWGDLSSLEVIRTPKTILAAQARFLTEGTNGLLLGDIDPRDASEFAFVFDLDIKIPTSNNYRVTVVKVQHDAMLYPALVTSTIAGKRFKSADQGELESALKAILQSKEVKNLLAKLISIAKEDD